ncbi:hypothetical protein ACS0TY_013227 [Phlomoides rotata]
MASVTVDSAAAANTADGGALRLDSIPIVDLRLLSQSELYSLSRFSASAFDPSRNDDVVIPVIDRSIFNESAGSRKQIYSRFRLAPSSSSPSGTPHRRTPHLRSTAATFGKSSNKSDPDNVENAQIVNLLKQSFIADMNPEDLVPVKLEYSNSVPAQQFLSPAPFSPSNVAVIGHKRKRGRPRKDEVTRNKKELGTGFVNVNVEADADVDADVNVSDVNGFSWLDEIAARENLEERDREVLNRDGVAVDLVALGAVEHPYCEEIGRKTKGLQTEEELLGFLKGLNGQWGSRRKKKRIVDASEFGSNLPVGWKLSLCIKKKNGQVSLYCRRYISPSGLHFVSCKGVSSYLCSLHGIQDTNLHSSVHYNQMISDADKFTTVPIAHLAIKEVGKTENLVSYASSPALCSTAGDREIQSVVNAGNLPEHRVGEILQSNKCSVTFIGNDELLQQSSLHRRNKYKNGTRITDGVIIKDGKYECQFCHKTFSERHRYNGHVGTHVRHQAKTTGESFEPVIPNSLNGLLIQDISIEGSLNSANAMEISDSITNNGLNNCLSCNKNTKEHAGSIKEAAVNMRVIDEATDIVTETNPSSVAENKSFNEDKRLNDSAAEVIDDGTNLQGRRLGLPLPLNDATHGVTNGGGNENSASIEKSEKTMASETWLSNDLVEECVLVNNSEQIYQTRNELNLNCEKFAVDGSTLDSLEGQRDQDNNLALHIKGKTDLESLPCKNTGTTATSTSGLEAFELTKVPNISIQHIAHDEKARVKDSDPCLIQKGKVGEPLSFGEYEETSKADNDGGNSLDEMQFEMSSVIPSWNEQKNENIEAFTHPLKVTGVQDMSKSQLVAGNGNICLYESNDDEVCRKKTEVPEFDVFRNFGNGESSDPFSSNHVVISSNSVTRTEQVRKLGVCSPFASATDKQLFVEDNMIRMFSDTLEEHRQEPSQGILLGQSGVSDVSGQAHSLNKIYATPSNPSELNKIENSGKHELSLSFGNLQTDMCADSNSVEQEQYQASSFNINSVVHKTYGNPAHLSIESSNIPSDMKEDRPFGIEFPNSSFNDRAHDFSSNFNMAQPERDWNATPGDNLGPSGQNFMVGFGNNSQPGECAGADASWRSVHENVFEDCFDANSGPQIPSSSCFHTFSLTSAKGEEDSFGVNKNYDFQSDMLRPGRIQPVEYSFMGEQSSNSLPGESKIYSFNTNMEQGLDPSFWLGKDALTPNAASQATSVCVWCRNVFFHDPVQDGVQTGAIGTMCPSCSSRMPGQFNLL